MSTLILNTGTSRNFDSAYERDFDDLVWKRRAGHMGHHEYVNESMPLWTKFIEDHGHRYYIPQNEISLIKAAGKLSASMLGNQPITLVSRGCGTKFFEKEGTLIRYLSNVVGVVYLDKSESALQKSSAEGRYLLPNAWHKTICADIYDPYLRYPVEGIELGTSFGLTFMNIEGFPNSAPPLKAYVKNLSAINAQMQKGAHFIVTLDHNQNERSVEQAYAGQAEFAKSMLQRTQSIDPDKVSFVVKFDPKSQTLFHGFQFIQETVVESVSGPIFFEKNDVIWFNNSVKPKAEEAKKWNSASGFSYARMDLPTDAQNRLGWHHLVK